MTAPNQVNISVLDISDKERLPDLTISAVVDETAALSSINGTTYDLRPTVDCYVKVAADVSGLTTDNGYGVLATEVVPFFVPNNYKIGVVSGGTEGTLEIHQSRTF